MEDNLFDDQRNKMFDDYDSEMHLEAEWKALQERRQPTKRPIIVWMLSIGFAIVGISWVMYSSYTTPAIASNAAAVSTNTVVANDITTKADATNQVATNEKVINEEVTSILPGAQDDFQAKEKLTALQDDENDDAQNLKTKKTNEAAIANSSKNQISQSTPSSKNEVSQSSQEQSNSVDQSKASTLKNTPTVQKNNELKLNFKPKLTNQITSLPLAQTLVVTDDFVLDDLDFVFGQTMERKKSSKASTQYLSLAFGYSPITRGSVLENEKTKHGISSSIHYKKYLSPKFYIATGLGFDQFTTQVTGDSENIYTQLEENQILERYYNADGTIEYVYGTGEVEVIELTSFKLYNRYNFISVPVLLGLQIYHNGKSHLEFETGVSATIVSQYEVKYFDGINQFKDYEDLDLRQTGLFSSITNLTWHYQPQSIERLDFFCRLGARLQLNDITSEQMVNTKRFKSLNFGIGVDYRL